MSQKQQRPAQVAEITLDDIDWRILAALQADARISNSDLAKKVYLSPSPCLRRVRDLEQSGLIQRYVTLLDPLKLGLTVSVFIRVSLEKQMRNALDTFENSAGARGSDGVLPDDRRRGLPAARGGARHAVAGTVYCGLP